MNPGQIWCVGRNYAEHAKELGNDLPTEPLIFLKAGSCLTKGAPLQIPSWVSDLHHELEIALLFGPELQFSALGLALDLTERSLQSRLKSKGQPWTLAKSFHGACPISDLIPLRSEALKDLRLELRVNGVLRQKGSSSEMIFSPETLRAFVLKHFPVRPGDLLLTGTPAGVGVIEPGDELEGQLFQEGRKILQMRWNRP